MLQQYAGRLVARLPKTAAGGTTGQAGAGTIDWYIKLNDEDVVVVCTIISTAEYCIEVVGALGRSVAKTIDPPFGNKVRPVQQGCCRSASEMLFLWPEHSHVPAQLSRSLFMVFVLHQVFPGMFGQSGLKVHV